MIADVFVGVMVQIPLQPVGLTPQEHFFMRIDPAPADFRLAEQTEAISWVPAVPPPASQIVDEAWDIKAIDRRVIAPQNRKNFVPELRRDFFIRINVEYPLVGGLGEGEALLLNVPRPRALNHAVRILPADLDCSIGRKRIDNNNFIAPLDTFQAASDVPLFVVTDNAARDWRALGYRPSQQNRILSPRVCGSGSW